MFLWDRVPLGWLITENRLCFFRLFDVVCFAPKGCIFSDSCILTIADVYLFIYFLFFNLFYFILFFLAAVKCLPVLQISVVSVFYSFVTAGHWLCYFRLAMYILRPKNFSQDPFTFTTACVKHCVTAVKRLSILHFCVFIFCVSLGSRITKNQVCYFPVFIPPQTLFGWGLEVGGRVYCFHVVCAFVRPSVLVSVRDAVFFLISWKCIDGYLAISADTLMSVRCTYIRESKGWGQFFWSYCPLYFFS